MKCTNSVSFVSLLVAVLSACNPPRQREGVAPEITDEDGKKDEVEKIGDKPAKDDVVSDVTKPVPPDTTPETKPVPPDTTPETKPVPPDTTPETKPAPKPVPSPSPQPAVPNNTTVPAALKGTWALIEPDAPEGEGSPVGLPRELKFRDGFVEMTNRCRDRNRIIWRVVAKSEARFSQGTVEVLQNKISTQILDGKTWLEMVNGGSGDRLWTEVQGPQNCVAKIQKSTLKFTIFGDKISAYLVENPTRVIRGVLISRN